MGFRPRSSSEAPYCSKVFISDALGDEILVMGIKFDYALSDVSVGSTLLGVSFTLPAVGCRVSKKYR